MVDLLRTEPGLRVDQPDFEHASSESQIEILSQLVDSLVIGAAGDQAQDTGFVVYGFQVSNPSGNTIRVTKDVGGKQGVAVLGYRRNGEAKTGWCCARGDAYKDYSCTGYADGTYGIYIRMGFRDNEFQNRLKWDPFAGTPVEYSDHIATRFAETWELTIELVSPGDEWIYIGSVTMASGSISVWADKRDLLMEGHPDNSFEVVDSEWGGGNDRNANRWLYGVFGVRRAVRGLQRQVQDILGGTPKQWWKSVTKSLDDILTEKLNRDGTQTMQGNLLPSSTYDLGSLAARWGYLINNFVQTGQTFLGDQLIATIVNHLKPRLFLEGDSSVCSRTRIWWNKDVNPAVLTSGTDCNIYLASSSQVYGSLNSYVLEVVFNAVWNESSGRWEAIDTSMDAAKYVFGRHGFSGVVKLATTPANWLDTNWDNSNEWFRGRYSDQVWKSYILEAGRVFPAATATQPGQIYKNSIVRAWGRIRTDGAGGFLAGGTGHNYSAAYGGVGNDEVQITFAGAMTSADSYSVVTNLALAGPIQTIVIQATYKTSTGFYLAAYNTATSTQVQLDTTPLEFDFMVVGN